MSDTKIDMEFDEFRALLKQTAENLKKMNEAQKYMRWQFGGSDLEEFAEFVTELEEARDGWVSSAC
jgi:hypothetical protein